MFTSLRPLNSRGPAQQSSSAVPKVGQGRPQSNILQKTGKKRGEYIYFSFAESVMPPGLPN
jgi:hypothetical protein